MSKSWAAGSTTAWRRLRAAVLARDGYRCQLRRPGCTGTATHAAHVVPKSKGGKDELNNLTSACRHCNLSDGDRTFDPPPRITTVW